MFFEYLQNYLTILIFLFVAIGIGIAFIVVNFLCAPSKPDAEKLSAYECGFEPFGDSRMKFDVRFYLVALKINPKHAGANEYLGELYLQTKRPEEAKKRLEVLKTCNCEEYKELKEKIEKYK